MLKFDILLDQDLGGRRPVSWTAHLSNPHVTAACTQQAGAHLSAQGEEGDTEKMQEDGERVAKEKGEEQDVE